MADAGAARTMFTAAEANEIRGLLDGLPDARRPVQRMSVARLRHMGLSIAAEPDARPTLAQFEELIASGTVKIVAGTGTRAAISSSPAGRVFRVAVGVTGDSIPPDWSAFDQRYQWFGRPPRSVPKGAHLFVLAVDRWKSAVVGLYEAVTAGAAKLPDSPDPDRWPWALGVRPLAAIPPPQAEQVDGQLGPQSGLPAQVTDADVQKRLYNAVAESPPPPGPAKPEQRVQEVEWEDVAPDVLEAVGSLGKGQRQAVIARAVEIGGWSEEDLKARAWYTDSGSDSHIENIIGRALEFQVGSKGSLERRHGVYSLKGAPPTERFGVPYRLAVDSRPRESAEKLPEHPPDLSELDRATKRHMELQDRLAEALRQHNIEPRSPGSWQPQFDLAFEHGGQCFVVEVKSGNPVSAQQMRLGTGQVLEYRHSLSEFDSGPLRAVLLIESEPPMPWGVLADSLGIAILEADRLEEALATLLAATSP